MKGDLAAAEGAYRQVMQMDGSFAAAYSHLAFLYAFQPKLWRESLEMAQKAADLAPDDPEVWAYYSMVLALDDHYDQLLETAQKAVKLDPENVLAHVSLAQAYLIQSDFEDAKTELEKALELDPQNVLALIVQAAYHSRQGEFDQALLSAGKAVDLAPDFGYARMALSQAHVDVLEYPEAEKQLEAALKTNPEYVPALLAWAHLCVAQVQDRAAWDKLNQAEELAPDTPALLVAQGWLYHQENAYDLAITRLQKAILLDKDYWPAYMEQGQTHYDMYQCQNSVDDFGHVLSIFPNSGLGHLWLAHSLDCTGEQDRAQEGYRKAFELAPHDADVLIATAEQKLPTQDYADAMSEYREAMLQRLYDPYIYARLGYGHIGSPAGQQAAESDFQQALMLNADNGWALIGMGRVYNSQHEYDKAIKILTQAEWANSKSAELHYNLGVAYTMKGNYTQAVNQLEQAWGLDNEKPMTLLYLARAYREVGEYTKAAGAYDEFLKSKTSVVARDYMRGVAQDLASGHYWFSESQVLDYMRRSWQNSLQPYLEDYITLSLVSMNVEKVDDQRTLKMVLEIEDDEFDDDNLFMGIAVALGFGAAMTPRIEPALDGGLQVILRDAQKQDLVEVRVSLQTAQDMLDGFISDTDALLQRISLQDLRRWKADLPIDRVLAEIGKNVEKDRNLKAKHQVQFQFITTDELRNLVQQQYEKESPEQWQAFQDMLVLMGLLESGKEFETAIDEQVTQIAGFYDSEKDIFYVVKRDEEVTVQDELTFAHEYVHALQDQYRDLSPLEITGTLDYDQAMAFRAVIEGEATQVTLKYFQTHLTSLEQMTALQLEQAAEEGVEGQVPTFEYLSGLQFVEAVAAGGYWPALDDVYKNLPTSTEQILHPDRYKGKRDDPQDVALPQSLAALEDDWQQIDTNVLGEYFTEGYLAEHGASDLAMIAADGWDGDRYAFFQNRQDSRGLLVWKMVWDSTEEAREFVMAHRAIFGEKNSGYQETLRELEGNHRTLQWESDKRSIYLQQQGDTTWLIFASRSADIDLVIPLLGTGEEQD
jgi:tetratricopeptide (TPR) repeat protein